MFVLTHILLPLAQANPFETLTTAIVGWLQALIIPGAVIGFLGAILFFLVAPLFPGLSSSAKGYIQMAILAVVFAGFVPGLVTLLYSMGGG